ncbi:zinc finger BED domain-containing protein DAYSLEEPER-like [Beta vulgaris subsp. vulgaris]|uniref:zinc finger BED domain-containing protein DAYSLEEPER-like n=1 Tax=Beta vulgaris subsp. vulgaris TaxID=3555 RepID=UPI0025465A48|nr:zinc finger BED domain-containing protein DAYSLEEPER-like [Beta vulgaris subsp. vulgaris]
MPVKGEVEQYLESATEPEDNAFDVLDWWKRDKHYPTLKKIAKDILAIPVSSVASESAFSMGGRAVSAHRSRLHSQTVEALMCLQNWMIDDVKDTLEGTHVCSTINEDCEDDAEMIDIIDMDVDDISSDED